MSKDDQGSRVWTGSRIKCLPIVESTYTDRKGRTRKRSVDQMIRDLNRRLAKSGIPEKMREKQYYTKPSEERHEEKKRIKYEHEKRNRRRKQLQRDRGDHIHGKHQLKKQKNKKNRQ